MRFREAFACGLHFVTLADLIELIGKIIVQRYNQTRVVQTNGRPVSAGFNSPSVICDEANTSNIGVLN